MKEPKKTKIVATLGPATNDYEVKKQMVLEGVNVFRFNFSHADYDVVKEQMEHIRQIREELGVFVGTLADLQGPKLRVGNMKENAVLQSGQNFILTTRPLKGDEQKAYVNYPLLPSEVKPGERILLDDGKIHLKVTGIKPDQVITEVLQGGELKSKKGINLPDSAISIPSLSEKDKKDLFYALEMKMDWIALSFVRKPEDIMELKTYMAEEFGKFIPVIAKIEKPEAVKHLDAILSEADGVMVARGDLGIEVPLEEVPVIQKKIVRKARKLAKPVIIATQMMESMIENIMPTRAEVNDVANSVLDGADAVMLSGETSVGKHPVEVIRNMTRIIKKAEAHFEFKMKRCIPQKSDPRFITKMICFDAAETANDIDAKAITTLTASGFSAAQISSHRPKAEILVFTGNDEIVNRMSLYWGVETFFYNRFVSTDETIKDIIGLAKEKELIQPGDYVINLTSMPVSEKGMVNTLRITQIKE